MLKLIEMTLEELISIQRQLIFYAERKKEVIIEREINKLNSLVKEETTLMKQLGQLESERIGLVDDLLQNNPSHNFSQFVEEIPDELTRKNLQSHMKTLQKLLEELQAKNKINENLLKDSMNFVQYMVDQVTKSMKQEFNYQSPLDQQKSQTSSRGFFDTKA